MKYIPYVILIMLGQLNICTGQATNSNDPNSTEVIAVVLGEEITARHKNSLSSIILKRLLNKYAKENAIEPNEVEIGALTRRLDEISKQRHATLEKRCALLRKDLNSTSLGEKERNDKKEKLERYEKEMAWYCTHKKDPNNLRIQHDIAKQVVKTWLINKSLYQEYGGRVIFQQAGIEPLDAYRDFLREQEKKGAFQILDKQYEPGFWRYFTNDAMHTFYNKEDGVKFINTPWWMMKEPPEKRVKN